MSNEELLHRYVKRNKEDGGWLRKGMKDCVALSRLQAGDGSHPTSDWPLVIRNGQLQNIDVLCCLSWAV